MPVLAIAIATYRDALRAAKLMPALLALALIVCLVQAVVADQFAQAVAPAKLAANLATMLAAGLLLTPVLIAIHRFVLLGETGAGYRVDTKDIRLQKYFICWGVLAMLFHAAFLGDVVFEPASGASAALVLGVWAVYFAAALKSTLLFPAIAIDRPGLRWSDAVKATQGRFWPILGVYLCVLVPVVPLMALSLAIDSAREAISYGDGAMNLVGGLAIGLVNFVSQLTWAIAASHIFRALEGRMRRAPGAGGPPMTGI